MCRWLAYSGPPIHLDAVLFKPANSLIRQSRQARMCASPTNGDGFGVGWYGERAEPGLFRDVLPAWNDENLMSVSEQIRAGLFFAHVRAATGGGISRDNCHPFRHGRWLFMHNGQIGGFDRVRQALEMRIAPALYPCRRGATDSEAFFYLLLGNGLADDPAGAFARTVADVLSVIAGAGVEEPFRMTAAASDGAAIYALRFSSDGRSPTLFYGAPSLCAGAAPGSPARRPVLVLSEPLDADAGDWVEVPEAHLLTAADGAVAVTAFTPAALAPAA